MNDEGAYQLFDKSHYERALKNFYKSVMNHDDNSDQNLRDHALFAIEEIKERWLPQVPVPVAEEIVANDLIPQFVRKKLEKKRPGQGALARFNCIDAAWGFHGVESDDREPAKPIDFLRYLLAGTIQVQSVDDFRLGDFFVFWNRSEGSWDNRKIILSEMNLNDSDFPYGLIFDHVAVRVTSQVVFHKPNPSPHCECRLDYNETAAFPSRLGTGHEVTLHRLVTT